ncbi:hypothetical protein IIA95_02125 [Patescibacteria group bacterium]|nr:hypothetical protein [Patescibacteria group bacterium]
MRKYTLRFRKADKDIFKAILNGKKKVETRAATIRYRDMKAGDVVVFLCGEDTFEKKVKHIQIFKTITAMLHKYSVKDIMPSLSSKKELENSYYRYPGYREKIRKYGLVALELK